VPQKSAASRIGASTVARKIAKENVMPETRWEKTAEYIGESVGQASCVTSAVADAVQEGTGVVRRAAKKGGYAAEESERRN